MSEHDEIKRLLGNLRLSAHSDALYDNSGEEPRRSPEELLSANSDLNPYKRNQAWPGRSYILIGNSYQVENKIVATTYATKRKACIAIVLERGKSNRKCVSVEDAFSFSGFVECLSRFEHDWLIRQPPSTLLGPAYAADGKLIPESFAVWRRAAAFKRSGSNGERKALSVR